MEIKTNTIATMKKLLFLFILMLSPMLASAQTVSDVLKSGCMSETQEEESSQGVPTIVLTKEGAILLVEVKNYISNCATSDFVVESNISEGSDGSPCSLNISVAPVVGEVMATCLCPFNVSFTIHDLEPNSFYLDCWWFKGLVELTEEEPLVLEDIYEDVTIDGMCFTLGKTTHKAMLNDGSTMKGDVCIPSELNYEGQTYLVTDISNSAFYNNKELTKVTIPRTVRGTDLSKSYDFYFNLFSTCTALESIEVEEGNPALCSIDGVLFNKDCTRLFCFPANASRTSYIVPEGVTNISDAFVYSKHLEKVTLPDGVTELSFGAFANSESLQEVKLSASLKKVASKMFYNCQHLKSVTIPQGIICIGERMFYNCTALQTLDIPESVTQIEANVFDGCKLSTLYIRGIIEPQYISRRLFSGMGTETEIYVQPSQVDQFKALYKGPVYPLPEQTAYYYYNGNKIPLTLNEKKVIVSIPKDCDGTRQRISAYVQILSTVKDKDFDIFVIPRSDFEKLASQDFWEEDAKSVVLTSCYFTANKEEIYETPYLNVRLKKEEDVKLLDSYAEKYKLRNHGSFSQYLPLWYILNVTPESDKSPLQCANELYESGDFAASVADLADAAIPKDDYRPFVEEGKVWKVGTISGNPVQVVDYYYFDGDTIIGGKTCKQMMCQRYVSPDYSNEYWTPTPSLSKVGAWYEEDQKVYFYDEIIQSMKMMYDFSLGDYETVDFLNVDGYPPYIIGPRQTGGIKGFKGVYRDIMMGQDINTKTPWLEGVGGLDGPFASVYHPLADYKPDFLMSCTIGDEVIYLNDEYEDGATPAEARKRRFDFSHTIKTKPKARRQSGEEQSLYGEYNDQQLGINLDPLVDAYQVRITDESGKLVYEKAVNAGSIVGLNIDISAYAKGRYTVTVENSQESFTGQFETQATGIEAIRNNKEERATSIYNLQGQRLNSLQKGLNIVNGRKLLIP